MGLNAAAVASACSARQFQKELVKSASSLDREIIDGLWAAVNRDDAESIAVVSASIAARLRTANSQFSDRAAEDLQERHARS
jgi:hypothetical protein